MQKELSICLKLMVLFPLLGYLIALTCTSANSHNDSMKQNNSFSDEESEYQRDNQDS